MDSGTGWIDVNAEVGPEVGRAAGASPAALTRELAGHGIATALVHDRAAILGDSRSANDALFDRLDRRAGQRPVAVLAPDRGDSATDVERLAPRVAAWWLHPRASVESLATRDLLGAAARTGMAIFVPLIANGDATRIAVATATLGVPVVLVGTHYSTVVDAVAAARRHEHLHLETSALAHFGAIETLTAALGHERLLFGSGTPVRALQSPLNAIAVAKITDDQKRAILGGNASRLLGITARPVELPVIRRPERLVDVHAHLGPLPHDVPELHDAAFLDELRRQTNTHIAIASSVEAIDTDLQAGNRRMVEACAALPDLRGHLVAYPDDIPATREQIRRYGEAPGVIGVKIGCEQSQPTASKAVWDVFDVLADYGRPVKIHNDGPGWADALAGIARAHPQLPIIIAHGGLGTPSVEGAALTEAHPNVYLEMCSSFADLATAREVVRRVPPGKLLFGSDAPLLEPAFILGTYQDAGIPAERETEVYAGAAERLFGLS
jgi:predicted TIM-barrel fold metal-dependent hydrolase